MAQRDLSAFSINKWLSAEGGSVDTIYDDHPLLKRLRGEGKSGKARNKGRRMFRELDGGDYIQDSPRIAQSPASTNIRGMEEVDASGHEVTKKALWEWCMKGKIVSIPDFDELRNSGSTKIISDWQDRITEALDRIQYDVEVDIGSNGHTGVSGFIGVNGLDGILVEAPGTGTIATIDRSLYSGWQNQFEDASDTFASSAYSDSINMKYTIKSVSGRTIDLMMTTATIASKMHKFLLDKGEVQLKQTGVADSDIEFRWLGCPVTVSQHITAESLYLLSTRDLFWAVRSGANFSVKEEQEGVVQFAKTRKLCFMGNFGVRRFDSQGVIFDITG